jgi:hypothetical protein
MTRSRLGRFLALVALTVTLFACTPGGGGSGTTQPTAAGGVPSPSASASPYSGY